MPKLLELAQLAQADRVAEMDVGRGGIKALLNAQRTFFSFCKLQPLEEFPVRQNVFRPALQDFELVAGASVDE